MLSLTYLSSATQLMSSDELVRMLEAIRPRNTERGLTGLLLYSGGNIIQTLEGPEDAVLATYADIAADPRHKGIIEVFRESIEERSFPEWSMGFRNVGDVDTSDVGGFSDYLQASGDEGQGAHHVRVMLRAFKQYNPS